MFAVTLHCCLAAGLALPAPDEKKVVGPPPLTRARIAEKLEQPFANDRVLEDEPLRSAAEIITARTGIPIVIDAKEFHSWGREFNEEAGTPSVSLPKLRGVTLRTTLALMLDPVRADIVIQDGYLAVVPLERMTTQAGDGRMLVCDLPHVEIDDEPILDAFRKLDKLARHCSVVVAPLSEETKKLRVSARFTNTSTILAVETLAEMADLDVIENGEILLVTTREKAEAWYLRQKERAKLRPKSDPLESNPGGLGGLPPLMKAKPPEKRHFISEQTELTRR